MRGTEEVCSMGVTNNNQAQRCGSKFEHLCVRSLSATAACVTSVSSAMEENDRVQNLCGLIHLCT